MWPLDTERSFSLWTRYGRLRVPQCLSGILLLPTMAIVLTSHLMIALTWSLLFWNPLIPSLSYWQLWLESFHLSFSTYRHTSLPHSLSIQQCPWASPGNIFSYFFFPGAIYKIFSSMPTWVIWPFSKSNISPSQDLQVSKLQGPVPDGFAQNLNWVTRMSYFKLNPLVQHQDLCAIWVWSTHTNHDLQLF